MPTALTRDELARRIGEIALLRGTFTLRSGRTSSYYLDKYLFSTRPDILRALGELFAERIPPGTTRLAGAELGRDLAVVGVARFGVVDGLRLGRFVVGVFSAVRGVGHGP